MPKKFARKRPAYKKRYMPKNTFRKRVLAVVTKQAEMKFASFSVNTTLGNQINLTNGLFSLEPAISQGDGTYERNGNKIRLHKVELVGYLNWKPQPTNIASLPANSVYYANNIVRMNVLRQRSHDSGYAIATNTPTGVFETNNLLENSTSYTGTLQNSLQDINRDAFINKKQMRIKMSGSLTNNGGFVDIDSASDMLKKFKYTMRFGKAGKVITYRTGGQTHSTNFPYFLTQVAHNTFNGQAPADIFSEFLVKWYYTDI